MNCRPAFHHLLYLTALLMLLTACNNRGTDMGSSNPRPNMSYDDRPKRLKLPSFNTDSAYQFIARQVAFGPRVPNTAAHKKCAEWMVQKMKSYCDTVIAQSATVKAHDGTPLQIQNIISSVNPSAKKRLLFTCHWDSRPRAEQDSLFPNKPIDAANDGASGVAVLMELARLLHEKPVDIGVDFIFFDAEDWGESGNDESYCLGSQYWGQHLHVPGYKADFCVNLDMVGGKGARFHPERLSVDYGDWVRQLVWGAADEVGASEFFPDDLIGAITDDHKYVFKYTHIPAIDIIDYDNSRPHGFNPTWHTHNDNLSNIDKATLDAVGRTLVHVIWNYDAGR